MSESEPIPYQPSSPESLQTNDTSFLTGAYLGLTRQIEQIATHAELALEFTKKRLAYLAALTMVTVSLCACNIQPTEANNKPTAQSEPNHPTLVSTPTPIQKTETSATPQVEIARPVTTNEIKPEQAEKIAFAQKWIEAQRYLKEHGDNALGVTNDIHPQVIEEEVTYWKEVRGSPIDDSKSFANELQTISQEEGQSTGYVMSIWQRETGWGTRHGTRTGEANWGNYAYSIGRNDYGKFPDDPYGSPLHNARCILGQFQLWQSRDSIQTYNEALSTNYSPKWENPDVESWGQNDLTMIKKWRDRSAIYVAQDLGITIDQLNQLIAENN